MNYELLIIKVEDKHVYIKKIKRKLYYILNLGMFSPYFLFKFNKINKFPYFVDFKSVMLNKFFKHGN